MAKTKVDELIEFVEQAFKAGYDQCYVETGKYKGYQVRTVMALPARGYKVKKVTAGGAYRVYPKGTENA